MGSEVTADHYLNMTSDNKFCTLTGFPLVRCYVHFTTTRSDPDIWLVQLLHSAQTRSNWDGFFSTQMLGRHTNTERGGLGPTQLMAVPLSWLVSQLFSRLINWLSENLEKCRSGWSHQSSCFVHKPETFSLLSPTRETRKYSHRISWIFKLQHSGTFYL